MNDNKALDLYAKIEPLINFYGDYERLYEKYLDIVSEIKPASILDFGCGNGRLLEILDKNKFNASGIDISSKMIETAKAKNVKAKCADIQDIDEKFDLIIAAADVLNYFDSASLQCIIDKIASKLLPNGFFIADINTLFGFENVADGTLIINDDALFLGVEAKFENEKLTTDFTLFEKKNEFYTKESQTIVQHFHAPQIFKKLKKFTLKQSIPFCLFGEKADKTLMILQKNY